MQRALNLLRASLHYRRECFDAGLAAASFDVVKALPHPQPGDVVLTWNRYGAGEEMARYFEQCGATALVVENGYLGKSWRGGEWFALAIGHHNGAGRWPDLGPQRWDSWGIELPPYRTGGRETLILAQRGIGEGRVRSPDLWAEQVRGRIGGRIRPHPGVHAVLPLEDDLEDAREVVTWNSGAALRALELGVPCWHAYREWIGAPASRRLSEWGAEPQRDEAARLAMFRRLAWAMWTLDEIKTGEPLRHVLAACRV